MNAKDLRVGNLVRREYYDTGEKTFEDIYIVRGDDLAALETDGYIEHDDERLVPISLTNEWFIKFHFSEIEGKRYSLYIGEWYIVASEKHKYIDICMKRDFNAMLRVENIEYVHQLQNLYYSILGKELTV